MIGEETHLALGKMWNFKKWPIFGTQRAVFGPKNGISPKSLKIPQNNFITSLQTKNGKDWWRNAPCTAQKLKCPRSDGRTDGQTDMLIAIPFGFLPRGKKGEYDSCRQLFPHMQKLGCALSKHLFVQCRIEAFYRKCFKKLAISLVLTMTQDIKVSIVEIVFSTLCRFSQVILDLWFPRRRQVQVFLTSLK